MSKDENAKKKVRTTNFAELASDFINYKPKITRPKQSVTPDDPYFKVMDTGHRLLVAKKRGKDIYDHLPDDLQHILVELDAIIKEMTLASMEDDFDYSVQLNRTYFNMSRISRLASLLSFKLGRFTKNKTDVELYLGNNGKSAMTNFVNEISKFASMADDLTRSSNLFMDYLEKEYTLDKDLLVKRKEDPILTPPTAGSSD
ncbi:hypothetical protein [Butyrivibrio sp. WCD3002]|uniref:hypothetical protein n=1 Tax=Butyrivibrio sp. WCD3002 TaxID=1280676 RepID=UPI0003FA5EAD|nr:hypothetical protein [Butyrivibrio sp. WCD3002]